MKMLTWKNSQQLVAVTVVVVVVVVAQRKLPVPPKHATIVQENL